MLTTFLDLLFCKVFVFYFQEEKKFFHWFLNDFVRAFVR